MLFPSPESQSPEARLKAKAAEIGFDAARITTASAPSDAATAHADAWLKAGMHGAMGYLKNRAELRAAPLSDPRLLAGARSVVVVAVSYGGEARPRLQAPSPNDQGAVRGTVARYARGDDYHDVLRAMLNELGAWVESEWPGERTRGFVDSGPIRERDLAARAGLGWQGKHTNLISLDLGNFFFLGALLTTLALETDETMAAGHCGTCTRCLSACPTGAIVAPRTLDARRCISYLTIELKGPIPRELRAPMGDRIFGCDDCLAACPWNERAQGGRNARLAARDAGELGTGHLDLLALLALLATDEGFRARFAGTPLLRPKREGLRRNVCVALGNVGGPESVAPLAEALATDPSPLVRGHAAWALGEIARRLPECAVECRAVLADCLAREADQTVREEAAVERPSPPAPLPPR